MDKTKMRRTDRQVTDIETINKIIASCEVIRIGLTDGKEPYIVPLNFGFEMENNKHVFYMHCANEGRKLNLIKENPQCCFEMDTNHILTSSKQACGWSMSYSSVMGTGEIEILSDKEEKIQGLTVLMKQYDKSQNPDYDFSKLLKQTTVLKLSSGTISCKVKD